MRLVSTALLCTVLASVGACSDRQERTVTDPTTGAQVSVQTGEDMRPPSNLPDHAPLYPGARIENVMETSNSGVAGGGEGGMVVFHADGDIDTIGDFYRERFERGGLTEVSEMRLSGTLVLGATPVDDSGRSAQVSIAPAEEGGGSTVTLIYSHPG